MPATPDFVFKDDILSSADDVLNGWRSLYDLWEKMRKYNNFVTYHQYNESLPLIPAEMVDAVGIQVQTLQRAHAILVGVDADPAKGILEQQGIADYFPEEPAYQGG